MKRTVLFLLAGILTALIVECNRTTPVSPGQTITLTPGPGAFGLGYMKGLSKSTANTAVKSGANVNFNLGSIKGSTAFYFLLYNTGSTPITNVTLSMADSDFTVYPSNIDTLIPGGTLGMLPIIKVVALHGTAFEGIGTRPLMPMGENKTILHISGTTKIMQVKDTTATMDAGLDLVALVMNLSLRVDGAIQKNLDCYLGGKSFDTMATLYNTGNVPIDIKIIHSSSALNKNLDTLTGHVAIGDSTNFRLGLCDPVGEYDHTTLLYPNTTNAVHSPDLPFPPDEYGPIYFNAPLCPNTINPFPFIELASGAACADSANRLYLIDSAVVFWDRQGACSDNSYTYTLFSVHSVDSVLCRRNDSVGGPQEQCIDQKYHDLLDMIVANLSATDLGMDSSHQVNPIPLQ
jgi:hypothetical protein